MESKSITTQYGGFAYSNDEESKKIWNQLGPMLVAGGDSLYDDPPLLRRSLAAMLQRPPTQGYSEKYGAIYLRVPSGSGGDFGLKIYLPNAKLKDRPIILMIHGGGFLAGAPESEEPIANELCAQVQAVVISVDYRLAPEHPYPTPHNDCYEALLWSINNAAQFGADPSQIIVAGSSAGANLASTVALRSRDQGLNCVVGQILMVPVTCQPDYFPEKFEHQSPGQIAEIYGAPDGWIRRLWSMYCPDVAMAAEPYASPLLARTHEGLPPAFIAIAGADHLRDDGFAYARVLKEAGVEVEEDVYPGMPHGFYTFEPALRASRRLCANVVAFAKKAFSNKGASTNAHTATT